MLAGAFSSVRRLDRQSGLAVSWMGAVCDVFVAPIVPTRRCRGCIALCSLSDLRHGLGRMLGGVVSSVRHLYRQGGLAVSWKGAVRSVRRSDLLRVPFADVASRGARRDVLRHGLGTKLTGAVC
jgi:hypothetical protein